MKIIKKGKVIPEHPWVEGYWECVRCDTVVAFRAADANYLKYHDSYDGPWIDTRCPVCKSEQHFHPVKEDA